MFALPFIIIIDLLILNGTLFMFQRFGWDVIPYNGWLVINLYYIICVLCIRPVANKRFVHIESIAERVFNTSLLFFTLLAIHLKFDDVVDIDNWKFCVIAITSLFMLFWARAFSRSIIKRVRRNGRGARRILFVGAGVNLGYLFKILKDFMGKGFLFMGYFDEKESSHFPEGTKYLGTLDGVIPWLEKNKPNIIYCNLPSSRSEEILAVIKHCEQNFIQFYSVPNVRNYLHRTMRVKMVDDLPVLALLHEPLQKSTNRLIKRIMDIIISGLFLITCFWWIYIIVAIITKITMPGPVFFIQKRNGYLGKEFNMIKFRSMKVNDQADTLQATKNDPRKTKWGNIMRKTNIDELPQFINVFLGDMSVVGPRPHMVKHTEQYSALIEKYMVRHWVKPGITGWAQVTGARGETEELWQMENRVQKDIWYIEHWSPWLDLRIVFKTAWNVIAGDKQAY